MTTATTMLAAYIAAETALLEGKEARIADRMMRFEDLSEIRKGRQEWQQKVDTEAATAAGAPRIAGLGFAVARMDR